MTDHSHILMFSIGPVQSFIAEARRTVDLYTGSQMLAKVACVAAQTIAENGGELIYPVKASLHCDADIADTPNIIVALVSEPEQITKLAQQQAEARWRKFADDALQNLEDRDDPVLQDIWQRQRDSLLEFYWVAIPYDPTPGKYPENYKFTSATHAARKRSRLFEAIEEDGLKDSLSGNRSALRTSKDAHGYWLRIRDTKKEAELQKGELLDAIGAMKRFAVEQGFPSTSTIASTSFVIRTCNQELLTKLEKQIRDINETLRRPQNLNFNDLDDEERRTTQRLVVGHGNYLRQIKNFATSAFPYGGDLLYVEGWARNRLAENYGKLSDDIYRQVEQKIESAKEILRALHQRNGLSLSPYYAILQMDGDWMGKHVSTCQRPDEHRKLSETLSKFTAEAKDIVENNRGYLVYAGGDDVLAFFPADTALTAVDALVKAYQDKFKDWAQKDEDGNDLPFTTSAGLTFAHYLHPLDGVLAAMRQAEKWAKKSYGRNALCVTVLRRSGETLDVGGKWQGAPDQPASRTAEMVDKLRQLLADKKISSRFPYNVYRDAPVVTAMNDKSARQTILRQLLKRQKSKMLTDEEAQELLKTWTAWANEHDKWTPPLPETPDKKNQGFAELARWFALARWLAGGGKE